LAWPAIGLYDDGGAARRRDLKFTFLPGLLYIGNVMASKGIKEFPARMADDDRKRRNEPGWPGTAVITKTKPQTKRPSMYRVLILNDDYTPMEFVVHVLERFFGKDHEAATRIMLHVHHHGIGECGIYTYEVAETKVTQVMDFARKHQHPLQCVMEKK
jgi:ATP-dependent Clp protease adaptor protein ClpS